MLDCEFGHTRELRPQNTGTRPAHYGADALTPGRFEGGSEVLGVTDGHGMPAAHGEPGRGHLRVSLGERNLAPAGSPIRRQHVDRRLVRVDADEVQGRGDDLQLLVGELRRVLAGILQVGVGVLAFEHHRQERRVAFARGGLGPP
jgi:hypothetical protein